MPTIDRGTAHQAARRRRPSPAPGGRGSRMTGRDAAEDPGRGHVRPRVHFTAPRGWINDPVGITWLDGTYHLYFQYLPDDTRWAPGCKWGHATGPDVATWEYVGIALEPQVFEEGCWSGSVVVDGDVPTILYTRIRPGGWSRGTIARAVSDRAAREFRAGPGDVVVDGPPAGLDIHSFRDPYVWRTDAGWAMLVGAGFRNGDAGAIQYRSPDLRNWTCDGVVCRRSGADRDGAWTGSLWECVQLLRVGTDHVLVVSVWESGGLHHVAAAAGSYDGRHFAPYRWSRITYGDSAYAMTTFRDRHARPCAVSWLREEPGHDPDSAQWAGALSVAATLAVGPDRRVELRPHPDLAGISARRLMSESRTMLATEVIAAVQPLPPAVRLGLRVDGAATLTLGDAPAARIALDPRRGRMTVTRPERDPSSIPLPPTPGTVDVELFIDGDILELFGAGRYGAYRLSQRSVTDIAIQAAEPLQLRVTLDELLPPPAMSAPTPPAGTPRVTSPARQRST